MVKLSETPLLLLLIFTLVYAVIGDPSNNLWSGFYFVINYSILLMLFFQNKSRLIRKIGISLSVSLLIFSFMKFFMEWNYDREYNIVPFIISIVGIILIEKRNGRV